MQCARPSVVAIQWTLRRNFLTRLLFLKLRFLVLDERSKHAHLAVSVLLEIEPKLLAEPQLEQVVIQRLFGHFHLGCCIF